MKQQENRHNRLYALRTTLTINSDGTGDIDLPEFLLWWDAEGRARIRRPAIVMHAVVSAVLNAVAPAAAMRRDARRALISNARSKARAQVSMFKMPRSGSGSSIAMVRNLQFLDLTSNHGRFQIENFCVRKTYSSRSEDVEESPFPVSWF